MNTVAHIAVQHVRLSSPPRTRTCNANLAALFAVGSRCGQVAVHCRRFLLFSSPAIFPIHECDILRRQQRRHLDSTFSDVFGALAETESAIFARGEPLTFYQNVSTNSALRDASAAAEVALKEYGIEREMRIDLFDAAKDARASANTLSGEDERLADKILLEGKRAGLDLPEEQRKELESKNCNEEKGKIAFTPEELEGIPADVVSGYAKRDDGKLELTFKTPDVMPLFRYAKNPDTRRRAWEGYESHVAINAAVFETVLATRRKIAALLKYDTWADYITEVKMVKTAQGVHDFIADVESKLLPVGKRDRKQLPALKQKEEGADASEFYVWDWYYYDRLYVERTLDLADALVKEYLPVQEVVPTIMNVYESMLGVEFVPLSNDVEKGDIWHPEVQRFAVWEAGATDASGFVGYTYLDLYPREGKYSHAAVWPLVPGFVLADGKTRNYPVTAMVANLAKPTPDRPALMTHDNVVTFFHEMGHVFHGLLSRTKYARFRGTSVARNFVEVPSQMLENRCWVPSVLAKMSSHYKTKEPLSPELIDKIIKSRYVNIGMFMLRQLFFGKYDITVHTSKSASFLPAIHTSHNDLFSCRVGRLYETLGPPSRRNLARQGASSRHARTRFLRAPNGRLRRGIYGYAYSLVFAADMYRAVFAKDPLSPEAGWLYRKQILGPGGSRDEMDSLKAFLGRPPNSEAFLEQLLGSASQ
ncbi:mitochondrial endopeptidase [Exidia glandulosa HHB12029]|uniref:Mitochondrial endopeptidase n=1 Tax=Exidia glandulosa HHB12029 TaxID=1314781 RepID=A0A166AWR8_EXIGL|nr:mitochondrial endopeptidase [Exidia glandulosa HHB12029]